MLLEHGRVCDQIHDVPSRVGVGVGVGVGSDWIGGPIRTDKLMVAMWRLLVFS